MCRLLKTAYGSELWQYLPDRRADRSYRMCRGRPGVVSVRGIFSDSGRIGPAFRVEMLVTWAFGGWPGFGLPGRRASDRIFSEGFLPGHNLTAGRRAFSTGLAKPAKVDRHRPPCRLRAEVRLRAVASVSEPKSAGDQGAPVPAISRRASSLQSLQSAGEASAVRTYEQRTTIRYQVSEISAFYPDCW